jgi:hypothetical protein
MKKPAKKPVMEKKTGEKYKSKAAMMKHEKTEGKSERMKEYGPKGYAMGGMIEDPMKKKTPPMGPKPKGRRPPTIPGPRPAMMAKGGMVKKGK